MNPLTEALIAVLVAAAGLFGTYEWGKHDGYRAEHTARVAEVETLKAGYAQAALQAKASSEQRERAITKYQQEKLHDAQLQADALRADRDRAAVAGQRLQQRVASLLAASCRAAGPAAAASGPGVAASAPADLLADVQRRLGEAEDRIAEFAEQSHGAAELCAADYEVARQKLARRGE